MRDSYEMSSATRHAPPSSGVQHPSTEHSADHRRDGPQREVRARAAEPVAERHDGPILTRTLRGPRHPSLRRASNDGAFDMAERNTAGGTSIVPPGTRTDPADESFPEITGVLNRSTRAASSFTIVA